MTPEEELEALENTVQDILRGIQDILQAGERLSDEFQGQVAQLLDTATQRIDELQNMLQGGGLQPPPDLEPSMPSSNIEGFAYDPKKQQLFVRFLGKYPDRNGPIYSYGGVPQDIFKLFQAGAVPARTNGKNRWGK